jgi:hypothetical protein
LQTLAGGTIARRGLPSSQLCCFLIGQFLEGFNLFLRRLQALLQRTTATKRALASAGACPA